MPGKPFVQVHATDADNLWRDTDKGKSASHPKIADGSRCYVADVNGGGFIGENVGGILSAGSR